MTEVQEKHPYDIYVNEKKAPQWIANFEIADRKEQFAEDVTEGRQLVQMLVGIASIGLVLGVIVLSYMFLIGTP